MRAKARYRVFWISVSAIALLAMMYLIVPPLVPLTRFRANFEQALTSATGAEARIHGDIRLSLLGHPMLSLSDVEAMGNKIEAVRFRISWSSIFNLANAEVVSAVKVYGIRAEIQNLNVPSFDAKLMIVDSVFRYDGQDFEVSSAVLDGGRLQARVRKDGRKYQMELRDGEFRITNPGEGLVIEGRLSSNERGRLAASGTLGIDTRNVNGWFGFAYPRLSGRTRMTMDFAWDGDGFFDFANIEGTNGPTEFRGRVKLWHQDGARQRKFVRLRATGVNIDLSFLSDNPEFLHNSRFDIAMSGNIITPFEEMRNLRNLALRMFAPGNEEIEIEALRADADGMQLSASGTVVGDSVRNMDVSLGRASPELSARCLLSGNRREWRCSNWSFKTDDISGAGSLSVDADNFRMTFNSDNMVPSFDAADRLTDYFGERSGTVEFNIDGAVGTARVGPGFRRIEYSRTGSMLSVLPLDLPLPESMLGTLGDIEAVLDNDTVSFDFRAPDWSMSMSGAGAFQMEHADARRLLAAMTGRAELPFLRADMPIQISGRYAAPVITGLVVRIGDMRLTGMASNDSITLDTSLLDMDQVLDQAWFDNFRDNQFVTAEPTLAPFGFGVNLALSADSVKLKDAVYSTFIYSLAGSSQKMSITDSENGSLLASVSRNGPRFIYLVQMNRFFMKDPIFGEDASVNIRETTVTAEAELETHGLTAHDIRRNMTGLVVASFDGGIFMGLGTDEFYNNANRHVRGTTEEALRRALTTGETQIKELEIVGEYTGGDFQTTRPFMLTARHTDITGNLWIRGGAARIRANIILRGTNPIPRPIALVIERGARDFSLSDILPHMDLDYLREFANSRSQF